MIQRFIILVCVCAGIVVFTSCTSSSTSTNSSSKIPVVAFIDGVQDETLDQAHKGFMDALKLYGYSDSAKTIKVIYRNAQGDIPTLGQSVDYAISQNATLIATNPSISTVAAIKKTSAIPVFMMVSPSPELAGLTDKNGKAPANLFGVYEVQDYIDTSVAMIKTLLPNAKRIGVIYDQAEPQSVIAIERVKKVCDAMNVELEVQSVTNSNDVQLATEALLSKHIDAFFAMPDNVVFSAFEVIKTTCTRAHVPIFTSEAGLVKRGAVAAYGADMYKWGFQAGLQAALYLKNGSMKDIKPELVKYRQRVCNIKAAETFGVKLPVGYVAIQ